MYEIKRLIENEFYDFGEIVSYAYPQIDFSTKEKLEEFAANGLKIQNEVPYINYYGVFGGGALVGGMIQYDFEMRLLSTKIKAGGIGMVAVHFTHKKEKVAKNIIEAFLRHYVDNGASMAILYPFRPDFYKKMGFGFGTSMNQYKVKPSCLPGGANKKNISILKSDDISRLLECYNRVAVRTNGLIDKYPRDFENIFKNTVNKVVGFKKNDEIYGYMIFEFRKCNSNNFVKNDMVIKQFVFENGEVLEEMMSFLNSQSDQISSIIFNTQDENFRFLLDDPRNDTDNLFTPVYHETNIQGTGIMYRVINTRLLLTELRDHNFNNQNCKLRLRIRDAFLKENDTDLIVNFKNGFPVISDTNEFDAEIELDIADFSSLITCSVDFNSLYKYNRAKISKIEYLQTVNTIFTSAPKPICLTNF